MTILEHGGGDPTIEKLHRLVDMIAIFVVYHIPTVQRVTIETLETIFAIKTLTKQMVLVVALETGSIALGQLVSTLQTTFIRTFSTDYRLICHLKNKMEQQRPNQSSSSLSQEQQQQLSQDEWMDLAERIDIIQGHDVWRSDPNSPYYERYRIEARIDELIHLMRRRDIVGLMYILRGSGIGRNKFGLLQKGLFNKAMAGTKVLVESYHNVVCAALDFVCDVPLDDGNTVDDTPNQMISTDLRLAFFNEIRHAYGRTALLLSGGAALGVYHVGVAKALIRNNVMPRVLGGASAGSIICAMIGTRTDEECIHDMFEFKGTEAPGHSGRMMLNFIEPIYLPLVKHSVGPHRSLWSVLKDLMMFKISPLELLRCDSEHFRQCLRANVGEFTFQEAFDRTGRILNITLTPNNPSDPPRLMNYLTTPHVIIWSAVVASCSIPGVWEPQRLLVKDVDGVIRFESPSDDGGASRYSDGSMEQDLPMQQLSEMFNVNHFIVSQANPHAVMFASFAHLKRKAPLGLLNPLFTGLFTSVLTFLKHQCRSWLDHVVQIIGRQRSVPQHATSRILYSRFFIQNYEGRDHCDISFIPWINHCSLLRAMQYVLYNPNEHDYRAWSDAAERETWKFLPAIKSHLAEEVTLHRCVERLRHRIVRESSLTDDNVVVNKKQQLHLQRTMRDNKTLMMKKKSVEKFTSVEPVMDVRRGEFCWADSASSTDSSSSGNNNEMAVLRPQGQEHLQNQPAGLATGSQ